MIDLKFDHVSKRYRIRQSDDSDIPNSVLRKLKSLRGRKTDFWAVRDVSFEVERGEALGVFMVDVPVADAAGCRPYD